MGDIALNQPLTVVLPTFNRERQLRSSILDILELSPILGTAIDVVVVDDGSTDETYETACELARIYPQVSVFRQAARQGLGAALDLVRCHLNTQSVMVHDGVSQVLASQLRAAVEKNPQPEKAANPAMRQAATLVDSVGSRRFASIRALHDSMEHAHRAVTGFYWIQLEKPLIPRRRVASSCLSATTSQEHIISLPNTMISSAATKT